MKTSYNMVNIAHKRPSRRMAVATGSINVGAQAFTKILNNTMPKGNVLTMAEIAGIQGAKKTSELIPLCHPLMLDQVQVTIEECKKEKAFKVYCTVHAQAKTGVEMEALAGVQATLLTIYDLTKGIEPNLEISGIRLLAKVGGKSGIWIHERGIPDWLAKELPAPLNLEGISCAIVVMSDRASQGVYDDRSGKILKDKLEKFGANVQSVKVIPDEADMIASSIQEICDTGKPDLLITSGGLGLGPRDVTPETLKQLYRKEVPGLAELLRRDGANFTSYSWLSRSVCGIIDQTLIITLPGNPRAVAQGIESLIEILPHALATLRGEMHDNHQELQQSRG